MQFSGSWDWKQGKDFKAFMRSKATHVPVLMRIEFKFSSSMWGTRAIFFLLCPVSCV